jgi:hypothetical protein
MPGNLTIDPLRSPRHATANRVPSLLLSGPDDSDSGTPGSSDAVALFADRARASGVALGVDDRTGPLVVSAYRRLDGMPLAIEMAAARSRSMSLAELHGRLDQRFRLLTGATHGGRQVDGMSGRTGRSLVMQLGAVLDGRKVQWIPAGLSCRVNASAIYGCGVRRRLRTAALSSRACR